MARTPLPRANMSLIKLVVRTLLAGQPLRNCKQTGEPLATEPTVCGREIMNVGKNLGTSRADRRQQNRMRRQYEGGEEPLIGLRGFRGR